MAYLSSGKILDVDIDAIRIANSLVNSDPIVQLTNSVSGGNHGTQATSGNRGIVATNQQNSKAAIYVETNDFYSFGNILSGKTKGSIYFLAKRFEQGVTHGLWTNAKSETESNYAELYAYNSDRIYTAWGRDDRIDFNPTLNLSSTYRLLTIVADTNDFRVYVDGTLRYSTASSTVAFPNVFELFRSMSVQPSTFFYWKGWMLRLLAYDVAHTSGEVASQVTEFANDYALVNLGYDGNRTMVADGGSFALTGQDATFIFNRNLSSANGTFALAVQDAQFRRGRQMSADNGNFALTGQDANFRLGTILPPKTLKMAQIGGTYSYQIPLTGGTVAVVSGDLDAEDLSESGLISISEVADANYSFTVRYYYTSGDYADQILTIPVSSLAIFDFCYKYPLQAEFRKKVSIFRPPMGSRQTRTIIPTKRKFTLILGFFGQAKEQSILEFWDEHYPAKNFLFWDEYKEEYFEAFFNSNLKESRKLYHGEAEFVIEEA